MLAPGDPARRGRLDGRDGRPPRARRRRRGRGRGGGRLPDRICRAGVDLERAARVGRVLEGLRGAARRHDPSPNALSTQLIVPTMVLLAAVLLARDLRLRAIALVGLVPWSSRSTSRSAGRRSSPCTSSWSSSPGGSGAGPGSPCSSSGWSSGPSLLPTYLQLRGSSVRRRRRSRDRSLLPATSTDSGHGAPRSGCVRDEPLIGQGYLAYKELAEMLTATRPRLTAQRMAADLRRGGRDRRARRPGVPHRDRRHAGARAGLVGDRHPGRIPRLCHRGVVQQPAAVRAGVRGRVHDLRRRPGAGGAAPERCADAARRRHPDPSPRPTEDRSTARAASSRGPADRTRR